MKNDRRSNHEKAPLCAAFVKQMRAVFGEEEVTALYVREGEVEIGRALVEPRRNS